MNPNLPFLSAAYPGIGGRFKTVPQDFRVDERPLYLPCGEGEHLYLRVTKQGLSTPQLVQRLSGMLGIKAQSIGVAGLKDAQALTTQLVSVHGVSADRAAALRIDEHVLAIEVLGRHRNRLRTGHHAGNVFRLIVRDVAPHAGETVPAVLEVLARRGVPNFFGPQRQGRAGRNYELGAALLRDSVRRGRMSRSQRIWYLNSYQSHLFNAILARRIDRVDRVLEGDWAMKMENGACFPVENAAAEQPRADRFEISPTGILFGSRVSWATGEPGAVERAVVEAEGTTPEALTQAAKQCGFRGERRSLRAKLMDLQWSLNGSVLTLSFALVPGAYATNVLRELMKAD